MSVLAVLRRLPLAALASAAVLTAPAAAVAAETTCRGQDVMAEVAQRDAAAHAAIVAEAAKTENAQAVLWRVEKDGRAASHLLGTIHLTDERVTNLTPAIKDALAQASAVALEVADLSTTATTKAMTKHAKLVMFTDGQRLDKLLAKDDYARVKDILSKAGMPSAFASLFRPWIVSMLLATSECERSKTSAGKPVLDMKLAEEAKARKIPLVSLETIEDQLVALAQVPDAQQIEMLRSGLKLAGRADDMMETMLQLYLRRQMGAAWALNLHLAKEAGVEASAFSGFQQRIVGERNFKMRDGAMPLLEKGGALIAVGALHLSGPDGLVALFRKAGYTVTAIE